MATLVKDEKGNLIRYRITPTVEEGHATLEGIVACRTYEASGSRKYPLLDSLSLSRADQATLLAEIKAEVAKAVPAGTTLSNAKYDTEFWLNAGHTALEADAFARPTVKYAADGPVPASGGKLEVRWVPSAVVKAAILAAALA